MAGQYPHGLTDAELQNKVNDYANTLAREDSVNGSLRLGPLLQLGVNELHHRETRRSDAQRDEETRRANATAQDVANKSLEVADRSLGVANRSFRVAVGAAVASGLSLIFTIVAAYYARDASISTTRWEQRQTGQLETIRQEVVNTRGVLEEYVKTATATASKAGASKGVPA